MDQLDRIEAVRARNNGVWMWILRIALEADPVRTKDALRQIDAADAEIGRLLKELAEC